MDKIIAGSGIDAVIDRVSRKAGISEDAATIAVDEVLTAVKDTLPSAMAAKLVTVVAGEETFSSWSNVGDKLRAARSMGKNLSKVGIAELSQRVKTGTAHTGQRSKKYVGSAAATLRKLWETLRARVKKPKAVHGERGSAGHD